MCLPVLQTGSHQMRAGDSTEVPNAGTLRQSTIILATGAWIIRLSAHTRCSTFALHWLSECRISLLTMPIFPGDVLQSWLYGKAFERYEPEAVALGKSHGYESADSKRFMRHSVLVADLLGEDSFAQAPFRLSNICGVQRYLNITLCVQQCWSQQCWPAGKSFLEVTQQRGI